MKIASKRTDDDDDDDVVNEDNDDDEEKEGPQEALILTKRYRERKHFILAGEGCVHLGSACTESQNKAAYEALLVCYAVQSLKSITEI